jgi:hypothetical protein
MLAKNRYLNLLVSYTCVGENTGEGSLRGKMFCLFLTLILLSAIVMVAFLDFRNSVLDVSAVEAVGNLGVYWDKNCSKMVNSIFWGNLTLGETKEVLVYVRNEGNETRILVLTTANWNPDIASNYLDLSWSSGNEKIGAGEIINITLSLRVSRNVIGISSFSFDIIFDAREHFVGDINEDGKVDMKDIAYISKRFETTPASPLWDPKADITGPNGVPDGKVNMRDLSLAARDFGKKAP